MSIQLTSTITTPLGWKVFRFILLSHISWMWSTKRVVLRTKKIPCIPICWFNDCLMDSIWVSIKQYLLVIPWHQSNWWVTKKSDDMIWDKKSKNPGRERKAESSLRRLEKNGKRRWKESNRRKEKWKKKKNTLWYLTHLLSKLFSSLYPFYILLVHLTTGI